MKTRDRVKRKELPGYPEYPESEDIYKVEKREPDINPDDYSLISTSKENTKDPEDLDFSEGFTLEDMDVPGSELDDSAEEIGSEDEENNFYSLGGDNYDK